MGHNKQERKRKEKEITKKKRTKKNKEGFEVTMSVEIITFKKLGFFPRLLGLFFLPKYSFRRAMLQLEFGESKPEVSQLEHSITETRKAASCSSETLRSNAGSGPAAAGCPVSNPDNLWKSPLLTPPAGTEAPPAGTEGFSSKLFNLASSSLGRFRRMNPRWKA